MKKSRSSIPRFEARLPEPSAPGLDGTAGPRPDGAEPAGVPLVAMQVGNTNEGSLLPANPSLE